MTGVRELGGVAEVVGFLPCVGWFGIRWPRYKRETRETTELEERYVLLSRVGWFGGMGLKAASQIEEDVL